MAFDFGSEEPSLTPPPPTRLQQLWHRVTVRLVLLLGIVVFFAAVGIDSLQQASAADMPTDQLRVVTMTASPERPSAGVTPQAEVSPSSYLDFDVETARRLGHSDLTSASMTRSRLTSAHFFTSRLR